MASSFQRYTGQGIQPVTGMAEAGANIGHMYQQGLNQLGAAIGEGIKTYGQNQQNSQMADAKLASGIEKFKQISSIYAQDPEFAPVVASFANRISSYQDAPNQSLSKKLVMANEIDGLVGELAQTIQAQQVVRGRQLERTGAEALLKINGTSTVTDPTFIGENVMRFDTSKTLDQNQGMALEGLNRFRQAAKSVGKEIKGTDAEFIDAYRRNVADSTNKAMSAGSLDKNVGSRILEQIASSKNIEKSNEAAMSGDIVSPFARKNSMKDYQAVTESAYRPETAKTGEYVPDGSKPEVALTSTTPRKVTVEEANSARTRADMIEKDIHAMFGTRQVLEPYEQKKKDSMLNEVKSLREIASSAGGSPDEAQAASNINQINKVRTKIQSIADKSEREYLLELQNELKSGGYIGFFDRLSQHALGGARLSDETERRIMSDPISRTVPYKAIIEELYSINDRRAKLDDFVASLRSMQGLGLTEDGSDILPQNKLAIQKLIKERIDSLSKPRPEPEKVDIAKAREMAGVVSGEKPAATVAPSAPQVGLGKQIAGYIQQEKPMSQTERKSKVAGFLVDRMGIVDPNTGQKVLPAGFDTWYKGMVPESDARVVDVDGVRLLWDGKKFEQVKADKAPTMKQMREDMIGVYGRQTAEGGLAPEEFISGSGVMISGIFKGSDTADSQFRDEQEKLIDARSSVKRLQEINDKTGETFSPALRGEAEVLTMSLKAALRRDIVGVGQVSNYEQQLIDRVVANPTDFFSLESKDRAILLALADRIDRKIISNGTKYGLSVEIKDNGSRSKYASLREKFLAEKTK